MDDLEFMLQEKRYVNKISRELNEKKKDGKIQHADRSANINDLISMINKLVSLTIKNKLNVEFRPNECREEILAQSEKIDKNFITYKVISRTINKELKPRVREEIVEHVTKDNKEEERFGQVYGQKFMSYVQFNIFSPNYAEADAIMNKFEDLMFTYSGYFKKNGIGEIVFEKELTDSHYDIYREKLSVRNIQYYVETEKLSVIFREKVKEVEILMSEKEA